MKKKSNFPETKVKNKEPSVKNSDWIIWAAWADRITFEEIYEKTGKKENEVIQIMRQLTGLFHLSDRESAEARKKAESIQ